jgi:ribonuclease J
MKLRVHRGTREIGGTCIELEYVGFRILLDLGLPLDSKGLESGPLPGIRACQSPMQAFSP